MRLPAHLEVAAMLRRVQGEGGFATVLHKGERDGGTILISLVDRGAPSRLYERMPQLSGQPTWALIRAEGTDPQDYADYLSRRATQDRDVWIIELDIPNGERFIGFVDQTG